MLPRNLSCKTFLQEKKKGRERQDSKVGKLSHILAMYAQRSLFA